MKYKFILVVMLPMVLFFVSSSSWAEVELDVIRTLKLGASPLDTAVSVDGRTFYILADDGNVYIYSADGTLKDKIFIGRHIDQIKISPRDKFLIASSRGKKTVQIIALNFVYKIDITGAPVKGPNGAPVVIAVFNDFQ
jgi:hypothetical protein